MCCLRLQKCCCFVNLKTGNIIIGCIVAVISFGLFITMLVLTIEFGDMEKNIEKHLRILSEMKVVEDTKLRGLYAMSIVMVFMLLAKFLFDIFFIYGVCTERAAIIKSYLISWVVFIVLAVSIVFCNSSYHEIIISVFEIIYLVLNVYMVILGYSYYVQIKTKGY